MRRKLGLVTAILLMLSMISSVAMATERVVCDVDVMTDHSARISLRWLSGTNQEGLMITSWKFVESDRLVVYYQSGSNTPEGFSGSSREIKHESYRFPMQVSLVAVSGQDSEFTDLSDSDPGYEAITNLYHRGIINGYPDKTFRSSNNVTRAEFSKMLLLVAEYELQEDLMTGFSDVSNEFWGRKYIMTLASRDILKGKGEGIFDPNGAITIGEVLTVLSRTFELYDDGGTYPYTIENHWSNEYFLDLVNDGLVVSSDSYFNPYTANTKATREDCAVLLSRVLENLHDVRQ